MTTSKKIFIVVYKIVRPFVFGFALGLFCSFLTTLTSGITESAGDMFGFFANIIIGVLYLVSFLSLVFGLVNPILMFVFPKKFLKEFYK